MGAQTEFYSQRASCFGRFCLVAFLLSLQAVLFAGSGCKSGSTKVPAPQKNMFRRDINAVLRDHDNELLALNGVVGVYVGVLDDGKTSCLKVMVVKKTTELERAIPKSLEGYPVVIEETGVIRPLGPH